MRSLLQVSGQALCRLEKLLLNGAAFIMFTIMMLVVTDVMKRYLFNDPIKWSYPLIAQYLMIYVFFLALADTLRRSQHIVIDFVVNQFGIRARSLAEFLAYVPSLFVFALIFWLGVRHTWAQYVNNDIKIDSLEWPSWVGSVALPIGIGAMLLRVVVRMGALLVRAMHPEADVEQAYGEVDNEEAMALSDANMAELEVDAKAINRKVGQPC
jgi:TRAP-type C4-dicarboxylate transport system permease small subunit